MLFLLFTLPLNYCLLIQISIVSFYLYQYYSFKLIYFLIYISIQILCITLYIANPIITIPIIQILLFVLAIDSKFYDNKINDERTTTFQNKILSQQVLEVQNIYTQLRGYRHDFHNHLQSLKAKLKFEQINEATDYLNQLEDELKEIKQLVETGNLNFDAILNSKLSLITSHEDIDLNCKVSVPPTLTITDTDLCALIGNLIDNAYESCEKMSANKFIRIYIGQVKDEFYISITNSTNEVIRKLDNEYITNKRGNHGHGLKRIDNIVYKYQGYINRKNEPGVFVTEILLPL